MHIIRLNKWLLLALTLALLGIGAINVSAQDEGNWPPLHLTVTGQTTEDGLTTISIQLINTRKSDLAELTVVGTIPEGAAFIAAELISAANPGRFDGEGVEFQIEHLSGNQSLGPLIYRFKNASHPGPSQVYAWAKWNRPTPGTAISSKLSLALLSYLGRGNDSDSTWAERMSPLLQKADEGGAQVGLMIYDLNSGRYYGYNAQELLTPASNVKLLTAAATLEALGPDYCFRTIIAYEGTLDSGGKLTGDLILQGRGDPTLTADTMAQWADSLVDAGLKELSGDILIDAGFFEEDDEQTDWGWLTDEQPYEPRVGAMSVNSNQVKLVVVPGETAGAPSWVRVEPALGRQVVYNNVATVASDGRASLKLHENESAVVMVEGRIPAGGRSLERQVTARSPSLYAGTLFRKLLQDRGVMFAPDATVKPGAMPAGAHSLIDHRSAPLHRVLLDMLKNSDNFISEQVLRTLGAETFGVGSSENGQRAISQFLEANGLAAMPYILCDGCGLRLDNELSAELVVGLLVLMKDHPFAAAFRDALAVAGVDGTLAGRLKNTPAQRHVYAKTGSLLGVSTLSGYIMEEEGQNLAFAILMNGPTEGGWAWVNAMRRLQDDMVLEMLSWE